MLTMFYFFELLMTGINHVLYYLQIGSYLSISIPLTYMWRLEDIYFESDSFEDIQVYVNVGRKVEEKGDFYQLKLGRIK